jgi:hypothetical protein
MVSSIVILKPKKPEKFPGKTCEVRGGWPMKIASLE